MDFSLDRIIISIPVILIALTIHELSHGLVAYKLGDPTAKAAGRLSLNPIKHLDPIGALLLLVVGFGWAKPVPVNSYYFKGDQRKGMMLVALAGPLSNLCMAFIGASILSLMNSFTSGGIWSAAENSLQYYYAIKFLMTFISINLVLMIFNLIPVPPLDGSRIVAGILPYNAINIYYKLEQYGIIIMMLLVFTGVVGKILSPLLNGSFNLLLKLAGIL